MKTTLYTASPAWEVMYSVLGFHGAVPGFFQILVFVNCPQTHAIFKLFKSLDAILGRWNETFSTTVVINEDYSPGFETIFETYGITKILSIARSSTGIHYATEQMHKILDAEALMTLVLHDETILVGLLHLV